MPRDIGIPFKVNVGSKHRDCRTPQEYMLLSDDFDYTLVYAVPQPIFHKN